jgi:excisionase family DNA binding protein
MMQRENKPMTIEEAAKFLSLSKSHIYKLTSRGEIPHYKPTGKRIYFFRDDLIDFLKAGRVRTNTEIREAVA